MQSDVVPDGKLELVRPRQRRSSALTEILFPTAERLPRNQQQVAAVCYRIRKSNIEFLLVQTRKGRWTFPKGGIVRGFTLAQSAAIEAFEEAGVHGRIEEAPFTRYTVRKRGGTESDIVTHAFLCEVSRTEIPQEPDRKPTWFPHEKAPLQLKQQRGRENGVELARVVERAVVRITRLLGQTESSPEPMRSVQFEASKTNGRGLIARFAVLRTLGRKAQGGSFTQLDGERDGSHKIVRLVESRRDLDPQ